MKHLLFALAIAVSSASATAQQYSSSDTIVPKVIIDNYFFKSRPEKIPNGSGLSIIRDSDGNRVLAIMYPKGQQLSEQAKTYALPSENIKNRDELLAKYNRAKQEPPVMTMGGASANKADNKAPAIGTRFPAFKATDIHGKQWTDRDITGKVMVLNLWMTSCGPCRREMPELSSWQEQFPDVRFFSSTYESAEVAGPVIRKHGFTWIPLVNDVQFREWVDNEGYPVTIVVDKKGIVKYIERGTSPVQRENILNAIKACVAE